MMEKVLYYLGYPMGTGLPSALTSVGLHDRKAIEDLLRLLDELDQAIHQTALDSIATKAGSLDLNSYRAANMQRYQAQALVQRLSGLTGVPIAKDIFAFQELQWRVPG